MSPENINPAKLASKEETQSSNCRKIAANRLPDSQPVNCPRCDSPNTKFCYYNNYSLTQPRHFCKTCKRYWTKGGALRNIPIGGGCRKTKKIKSSSSSSKLPATGDHLSDQSGTGLKFFHGTHHPAMDFQLGHGLSSSSSLIPRLQYTQFSPFGDNSIDPVGSSFMGFNFPLKQGGESGGAIQGMNVQSNLASSIESLRSMNQDLHWKLQQQRLSMLFGGGDDHQNEKDTKFVEDQSQKLQPILFQTLEISRKDGASSGDTATEWFFDNSYAPATAAQVTNGGSSIGANSNDHNTSNWDGIQAWNHLL